MYKIIVIADDLTGANVTGAQLIKEGQRAFTLIDENNAQNIQDCDSCAISTDSRGLPPEEAYDKVYNAVHTLKSPQTKLYSKRIDSTLRGNLGSETSAFLDALNDGYIALVVPSFPQAGRTVENGRLFVNGIPLHQTDAAKDPKNPIDTNIISDVFARQTKYQIANIKEPAADIITRHKNENASILIFDASTSEDLDRIACEAISSGVKFIAVDPGAFTGAVCRNLPELNPKKNNAAASEENQLHNFQPNKKALAVIGSVNTVAANQVTQFLKARECSSTLMDVSLFLNEKREQEIDRIVDTVLEHAESSKISLIIGSGIYPENRIKLRSGDSIVINEAIAEITQRILLAGPEYTGLYTSGGDISVAVCNRLRAYGIHLHREVVPLGSFGQLKGGNFDGLEFITKGGMVGDENALVTCIDFLLQAR